MHKSDRMIDITSKISDNTQNQVAHLGIAPSPFRRLPLVVSLNNGTYTLPAQACSYARV